MNRNGGPGRRCQRRYQVVMRWRHYSQTQTSTVTVWAVDPMGAMTAAKAQTGKWGATTAVTPL